MQARRTSSFSEQECDLACSSARMHKSNFTTEKIVQCPHDSVSEIVVHCNVDKWTQSLT